MHVELNAETDDEYFRITEIKQIIQQLSDIEILKLGQIARIYTNRSSCLLDSDELLNQAIIAIASGKRKFPREVPLLAFFAETMRSIAFNEKRKASRKFIVVSDDPTNDPILNEPDKTISVENEAIANGEIEEIYNLFKSDDDVTLLLMAKYEGLNPSEICNINKWDRTKYNTIQKRLRRTLNRRFPNGREHG